MKLFEIDKLEIRTDNRDTTYQLLQDIIVLKGSFYNSIFYDGKFICRYIFSNEYGSISIRNYFECITGKGNPLNVIYSVNDCIETNVKSKIGMLSMIFNCNIKENNIKEIVDCIGNYNGNLLDISTDPNDYNFVKVIRTSIACKLSYREYLNESTKINNYGYEFIYPKNDLT